MQFYKICNYKYDKKFLIAKDRLCYTQNSFSRKLTKTLEKLATILYNENTLRVFA